MLIPDIPGPPPWRIIGCHLRAGSDIVFLGALINYTLANEKYFRDYVSTIRMLLQFCAKILKIQKISDGVFSGFDPKSKSYNPETWLYEGSPQKQPITGHSGAGGGHGKDRGGEAGDLGEHKNDVTLQHPRCVFQVLKRHFARYTPEMVERACGIPKEKFLAVAEVFTSASGPEKTGAICYAVGWTQHSKGVQIIRAAAILQLLLGNIGRPGGGILALRGHATIQGSTDIPTLYDILPGYIPMPCFESDSGKLSKYISTHKSNTGWWANFDKYIVSLLKAWYGEAATSQNEFGFNFLPRVTGDHSHFGYWLDMEDGKVQGLFVMGQNPAVGAPNARLERKAMSKLKWLVVRDMVETETATFWKDSPEIIRGEMKPEDIATEVFFLPASGHAEKAGSFTNTQRLMQFREKAVDPPEDCRSETWFMYHLGRRLKARAAQEPTSRNAALNSLPGITPRKARMTSPWWKKLLRKLTAISLRITNWFPDTAN